MKRRPDYFSITAEFLQHDEDSNSACRDVNVQDTAAEHCDHNPTRHARRFFAREDQSEKDQLDLSG